MVRSLTEKVQSSNSCLSSKVLEQECLSLEVLDDFLIDHSESVKRKWNSWRQILLQPNRQYRRTGLFIQNRKIAALVLCLDTGFELEICYLSTHPTFQSQGCMTKLLEQLKNIAFIENKDLYLEVSAGNLVARDLYQKIGFLPYGERLNYYSKADSAIRLCRLINPCQD